MTTDLTREEIERLCGPFSRFLTAARMQQRHQAIIHEQGVGLIDDVCTYGVLMSRLLHHALTEPDRIAAAERRGAEAMREAVIQRVGAWSADSLIPSRELANDYHAGADDAAISIATCIRALPLPDAPAGRADTLDDWFDINTAPIIPAEPQPDADGWIPWAGGDCPVRRDDEIDVRTRCGFEFTTSSPWTSRWTHGGPVPVPGVLDDTTEADDIVAYRIVNPAPVEPGLDTPQGVGLAERVSAKSQQIAATGLCTWEARSPDAAYIAALEAENARLREVLACVIDDVAVLNPVTSPNLWGAVKAISPNTARRARALLQGERHDG